MSDRTPEEEARFTLGFRFAHAMARADFRARVKAAGWRSGMIVVPIIDPDDHPAFERAARIHMTGHEVQHVLKVWSDGPRFPGQIKFSLHDVWPVDER